MARFSLPAALILALALTLSAFGGTTLAQDSSVDVELGSFYIDMPTTIPAGPVTLNVTAVGEMPHSITIEGNGVSMTMPETLNGTSTTWEIDLEPGTYTFWCPIGNHRQQGMEIEVTVTGAEEEEPTATEAPADPTATTPAAADPTATVDDGYNEPSSTPTALPGLPNTGAGGSQSDGTSTGMLVGAALLLLVIASAGGGLFYRRQRNLS